MAEKLARYEDEEGGDEASDAESGFDSIAVPDRIAESMAKLSPEHLRMMDEVAKEEGFADFDSMAGRSSDYGRELDRGFARDFDAVAQSKGVDPNSFWYDDEQPDMNWDGEEEFEDNDMTHMAHGRLDEVREMRHYARLAVWELPLLSSKSGAAAHRSARKWRKALTERCY
jgi:small subunit ribosomal protein S35